MDEHRALRDVGEFPLINRIASILGTGDAVVGIGDDAAVLEVEGPDYLLATVDMLVEDVHFVRGRVTPFNLGRRALAINVSDIAAMGGRPTAALTSIALRPELPLEEVDELYTGIRHEADRFGLSVVGGNVTRTAGPITLDITVLGRVNKGDVVRREGARPGDVLAVTGFLGDAAAARMCAESPRCAGNESFDAFRARNAVPEPRVEAASLLGSLHLVDAMIDLSDGLAGDVQHLADRSRVGAVIISDALPISLEATRIAEVLGVQPQELALEGGEDYELLVALPEEWLPRARQLLAPLPLTTVGAVLPAGEGCVLERAGRREPLRATGWRHF